MNLTSHSNLTEELAPAVAQAFPSRLLLGP